MSQTARNILYLCASPVLGGAQNGVLELMSRISHARYLPTLLTGGEGPMTEHARARGIETMIEPLLGRAIRPWRDWRCIRRLRRLMERGRFHIVSAHGSKAGIVGRFAAWRAGVPVVLFTAHGFVFLEDHTALRLAFYRFAERVAARRCHRIVAVSEHDRKAGLAAGVGRPAQYEVIPNGVDLDAFDRHASRPATRAELGLAERGALIGTVAMFYRNKGLDRLVETAARVIAGRDDVSFALVGGDSPDRLETTLRSQIHARGLGERVRLLGVRHDVPRLLPLFDVYFHPSRKEGLPWAVIEAQAAARAVVASRVGGVPEVVVDHETGLLVESGDLEGYARALLSLVDDAPRRRRMGAAGRAHVEARFTMDMMIARRLALYDELTATFHSEGGLPA